MGWSAGRVLFVGQLVVAIAAGLVPVAVGWLLRAIVDALASGPAHGLTLLALLLGVAGGTAALLPNVGQYLSAQSSRAVQKHATDGLFTAVNRLAGLRELENPAFQDRLRIAGQAGSSTSGQVMSAGVSIVQSALTLAGFGLTLAVLSPAMAVIMVVATAPAIYLERGAARRQVALINGISHGQRRQFFYANLLVSLAAAKEIRLLGLGGFFRKRMLDEMSGVQRISRQADRRVLASSVCLGVLSALVTTGGLFWAVHAAATGSLTVGDVTIFVGALGSVASSLTAIINSGAMIYQAAMMLESYQDVVTSEPDLPAPAHPVPVRPLLRGIELEDVWFRYGNAERWILRGVNCLFPHGKPVALVGHNGAGKSTLVKLLCRFYDPDRGRILWDGVDLRDMDVAELRKRISAVFQDYMTYELSAAENIAVGDLSRADDTDSLTAAAARAEVHETLAALPAGYETLLTRTYFDVTDKENPRTGVLLSGGQWQRVALARAFLRGSRDLMILDEPSSGLDAEAEHKIHNSLATNRHSCVSVLISHRLSAIRDAGHIVVLSDGVVSEQGNHELLMAQSGIYARLFSMQAQGYATDPALSGSGSRSD